MLVKHCALNIIIESRFLYFPTLLDKTVCNDPLSGAIFYNLKHSGIVVVCDVGDACV